MFLNIVDKYAEFRYGKLILKEDNIEEHRTELEVMFTGLKSNNLNTFLFCTTHFLT